MNEDASEGITRRDAWTGLAAILATTAIGGAEAQARTLQRAELQQAMENIETVKGIPVVATASELKGIKEWCVNVLLNDERFMAAVFRVVQGQKSGEVRYSKPQKLQALVPVVESVEVSVQLPPGATKWTWSNGGRGVEGYEAVFVNVKFKDNRNQILYFHRNLEKIDHNRKKWE